MKSAAEAIAVFGDLLHLRGTERDTDPDALNAGLIYDRIQRGTAWEVAGYTVFIYQPEDLAEMGSHSWWGIAVFITTIDVRCCGVNFVFGRTRMHKDWIQDSIVCAHTLPPPSTGVLQTLCRLAKKASNSSPETYLRVLATALLRLHQAAA